MAAQLMLGDTIVAEWTGGGYPPASITFAPDNTPIPGQPMVDLGWPVESMKSGSNSILNAWRGSPVAAPNLSILVPFYVWLVDRSTLGAGSSPWNTAGAADSDWGSTYNSARATTGQGAPLPFTWAGVSRIVFKPTPIANFLANGASISAVLGNSGGNYNSGDLIADVDESLTMTASPVADGEGHDGASAKALVFWKWVCEETGEEFQDTEQITVSFPAAGDTRTYVAYWRPKSFKLEVEAGDSGVNVMHLGTSGLFYAKDGTGEPSMPTFAAELLVETDRKISKWTKTVYTLNAVSGISEAGTPTEVAGVDSTNEEVLTLRETGILVARVVYKAFSASTHDRVSASISNTYLLKGADYTLAPTTASIFGTDDYAGEYSLAYLQPADVSYLVKCRRVGDLVAGEFTGADSGAFVDSNTGKTWHAGYILFAVNAAGDPVTPEDPEYEDVPEDPDAPNLPGGSGGGGAGSPVGTSISLELKIEGVGVTSGFVYISNQNAASVYTSVAMGKFSDADSASVDEYYALKTQLMQTGVLVLSVTHNGSPIEVVDDQYRGGVKVGDFWPIPMVEGPNAVVCTIGFPPLKALMVSSVSVPPVEAPATDSTVTISPAPLLTLEGVSLWAVGTFVTLTPVPAVGYSHELWQRADAMGAYDEEAGGAAYGFSLDADTVVTATFRRPELNVVLTVKGSTALADHFDWTHEDEAADDTVPAEFVHDAFLGHQIGIFKTDNAKLQTAGDAAYNTYVDMPVRGVDVSYDGGATWEDAGSIYPAVYNATTAVSGSVGRAAARLGKLTITQNPLNDTLHIRIRLVATVSISVGMPPVRGSTGVGTWGAAGSMIGTGQNNWACGFGTGSISGTNAWTGAPTTVSMPYSLTTLARVGATIPVATLVAQESSPYPDYYDSYPYMDVEFGDTVQAQCVPQSGFYFAAWIDGYFSHDWEDDAVAITSEDRLVWPTENYISTQQNADVVVNEGIKKIMLKMKQVVPARWVLFTADLGQIKAPRPSTGELELITPSCQWSYYNQTNETTYNPYMYFRPTTSVKLSGDYGGQAFNQMLEDWRGSMSLVDFTARMTELGITSVNTTLWQVNRNNLVTLASRVSFALFLSWAMSGTPWYDSRVPGAPSQYLGVYRRAHLTTPDGEHTVSAWEFVGRGTSIISGSTLTSGVYVGGLAAGFTLDVEYRVRWVPYEEPTTPEVPYQITVGYQQEEDMAQGVVSAEIAGLSTGEINSQVITPEVQPGDQVMLHATPKPGFTFVSWVDAEGDTVSEEAEHTIDPDTEGYVFLANFTANIVEPVDTVTNFHVGFVEGNSARGTANVRIWRADTSVEDYTVPAAGAEYQLFAGDNAYVWATAGTGWDFGGWVNGQGIARGTSVAYDPLADSTTPGLALWRDVFFAEEIVIPETGNVPFRAGFDNPSFVARALIAISVNGALVGVLNGLQYVDMMLTEGDSVSLDVMPGTGYELRGFVDRSSYMATGIPMSVRVVTVLNQGLLAVIGTALPPVIDPPIVEPGVPVTGAGLWLFDAGAVNKGFVWRSKRYEIPVPTEFNSARVSRNGAYFPQKVQLRINAYSSPETTSQSADIALQIASDEPRRLPRIRKERYFEIEVTAQDDIESVKVATSMGELQNG